MFYSSHPRPVSAILSQVENTHFEEMFAHFSLYLKGEKFEMYAFNYGWAAAFIQRPLTRRIMF